MKDTVAMQALIHQLKAGHFDVFDEFYELTKRPVYYAAWSILKDQSLAEDILQDTYMRFLNHIQAYQDQTNVIAYLVTIAHHLAINLFNRRKREQYCPAADIDLTNASPAVSKAEETPLMDLVTSVLFGEELDVFILHVINEMKHREIAVLLDKPLGTILWIYQKAVKKLKQKVGESGEKEL